MTRQLSLGMSGHHSARSQTDEWLTPPDVIDALGGADSFDLDPAAPIVRPWPTARAHYTEADNGLLLPWQGRIWLNPPYSNSTIGRWLGRLADHGRGTALIFARTETENFVEHVWKRADAVLFLWGRLHFHFVDGRRAKANAGAPSVLCAYGADDAEILAFCNLPGQFVPLQLPSSFVVLALSTSWREAVLDWATAQEGPFTLAEAYRAFARHPKARRNPNYQAKLRQVLQRGAFERVGRGVWRAAA